MSADWVGGCQKVLDRVLAERHRQVTRYGLNDECPDGTGPLVRWLAGVDANLGRRNAVEIEANFRDEYVRYEKRHGVPTWMHLVREEVAEAFKEADPERLAAELVQIAALCVSWVEHIERRS